MQKALFNKVTFPSGSYVTNEFDSLARLKETWLKNSGNTALNKHAYVYNDGNQRTKQTLIDGNYLDYSYDDIGQLIAATGKESGGNTHLHEKFGYGYDAANNLNTRTNNALVQTFNVDDVNELTSISRSGTLTVSGTSGAAATGVTVNGSAATRYGDHTFAKSGLSISAGNNTFTAIASDSLGRSSTNSITVNLPSSVTPTYDDNGNLTNDDNRDFVYDDENQLVEVHVTGDWKTTFTYDGRGRLRIRKEYDWTGSAWDLAGETRYIYDGMLAIQERNADNLPTVTYTHGLDLSGTLQEAGGIGGLLARTDHQNGVIPTAYYHSDGNGNVTALVNDAEAVVGRYHYDPFGDTISASGPVALDNTYRFSSKEYHANCGLYYYGYRSYDPNLQRWPNRDPIQERGGINMFTFNMSDPINMVDPLGLIARCLKIGSHKEEIPTSPWVYVGRRRQRWWDVVSLRFKTPGALNGTLWMYFYHRNVDVWLVETYACIDFSAYCIQEGNNKLFWIEERKIYKIGTKQKTKRKLLMIPNGYDY